MNLYRTKVGIDPSGRNLAVAARGQGLGRTIPPVVTGVRSDREPAYFEEAGKILLDFVTRNGLSGSPATLCIPADRVYTARLSFPRLREKDMRPALELELERLFPFPSSRLQFCWDRIGKPARGKTVDLIVAATPSEYIERWQETASRAGLLLSGAVPAGWAVASACFGPMEVDGQGLTVILREVGESVECSIAEGRDTIFCSSRPTGRETDAAEARSLIASGLTEADVPAGTPLRLISPSHLSGGPVFGSGDDLLPVAAVEGFAPRAAKIFGLAEGPEAEATAWEALGAFGAAVHEKGLDMLRWRRDRVESRAARAVAWATGLCALLLALAWPGAAYWKTKSELARLDGEIAAVRPMASTVESQMRELEDLRDRYATLLQTADGRGETLLILKELTDRLPDGTWLNGLRIEDGKVSIDGVSSSASELFPLLTRGDRFRKVEFGAPITRQPDNLERFQIQAEFVPASGQGGGTAK